MDGEDVVISNYFKNKEKGFYIDIGCYHPIHRNNTFLLFKKGWQGMNVDIHDFSIVLFNYARPKDLNSTSAVEVEVIPACLNLQRFGKAVPAASSSYTTLLEKPLK